MRRLLIAVFSPWLLLAPAIAGDLGPADLTSSQMSEAFPPAGQVWEAHCGTRSAGKKCKVELGKEKLIIDDNLSIPYGAIIRSDKWDTFASIAMERSFLIRFIKPDTAYTGWDEFIKDRIGGDVTWNTVMIEYKDSDGKNSVALFAFADNRAEWYGFANAMRMISYGARPSTDAQKSPTLKP